MSRYFPLWKDVIRFGLLRNVLAVAAVYFFVVGMPIAAIPALAAAGYCHVRISMAAIRLTSARKVMINH
jgi:hypothetical protein